MRRQIKRDELGKLKPEDPELLILQVVKALAVLKISVKEQTQMAILLEMAEQ